MGVYRRKVRGKRTRSYTAEFVVRGKLYRQGGFPDRESADFWLKSESLRIRRAAVGYIKPSLKSLVMPLIEQYASELRAKGRDREYCYIVEMRLRRLAAEAGWLILGDITHTSADLWQRSNSFWANRPRPIKAKTKNDFLLTARTFCAWLVKPQLKLDHNPLADVALLPSALNTDYRRAGTEDELNKLLATCAIERRTYYLFRLYCPLRTATIAGLTWHMMHLDDEQPWMLLTAALNKSRKDERSAIPMFLAQMLRRHKRETKAKADDPLFPLMWTLEDLRSDLKAAGVAFDDGRGNRRLDFHAFRKTLVRLCRRSGLDTDYAGKILHHKDSRTTRKHYMQDAEIDELSAAVERLPIVGKVRSA